MKKTAIRNFLAIALVLCMMLQLPAVFAAGKIFPDITEDEADSSKLLTVGRKDGGSSEKPGENQTRDYLAFLQKLGIITEETAGKMDVLSVYKAAYRLKGAHMSDDFIAQQAAQSGISQDARLTYPQAVKAVLDALDYTGMAQLKGGYPNGYLFVANALRLATNVDVTNFAPADFYALLFNALGTSASTMELSGGDAYLVLGEATILEEYFDVYIEKEVVTACYKKSISQNVVDEDEILLGQRVVKNGGFDMSNMVGSKIKAYVYQGDPYGELYFYESESTKTLTLDLSKIDRDSITEQGLKYENEAGKSVSVKLEEPKVIYNGRSILAFSADKVKPFYVGHSGKVDFEGTVTFIDSDGNGKYDVLDVSAYENKIISNVAKMKRQYKDYYDVQLGVSQTYSYATYEEAGKTMTPVADDVVVMKSGRKVDASQLANNDVVNIYASAPVKGASLQTLVISSQQVKGAVTGTTKTNIRIDSTEYELSNYFQDAYKAGAAKLPKAGENVTATLNESGKIVRMEISKSTNQTYGFMVDFAKVDALGGGKVKIMDTKGEFQVFTFDEISFNGTKCDATQVLSELSARQQKNAPVSYKLNADGTLSQLNIEELINPVDVSYDGNGGFTVLNVGGDLGKYNGSIFRIANTGALMGIGYKSDGTIDLDYTSILALNDLEVRPGGGGEVKHYSNVVRFAGVDTEAKTVQLAVIDTLPKDNGIDYQVPYYNSNVTINQLFNEFSPSYLPGRPSRDMFLVEDVSIGINANDEEVYMISGMQGGQDVSAVFSDKVQYFGPIKDYSGFLRMGTAQYTTNEARLALLPKRFQNPSDVVPKVGDIAAVTLDKNGEIVEYKILANVNEYPDKVYTERTIGANMQWGYDFSFITKVNATTFSIGIKNSQQICYDTPGRADIQGNELSLSVPAYKWNFEKQCFETISMPEIYASDSEISEISTMLGDNVDNNVWVFVTRQHWPPTEYIVVDYAEK